MISLSDPFPDEKGFVMVRRGQKGEWGYGILTYEFTYIIEEYVLLLLLMTIMRIIITVRNN